MYASRNIDLCSKDCLCLFVCPTGATDTETGQIDKDLCLDGCRLCVDTCPSHAIYLVLDKYPDPKEKNSELAEMMLTLLSNKSEQELMAEKLALLSEAPGEKKLAKALQKSLRILAEDCAREAGFILPQSAETQRLLKTLAETSGSEQKNIILELLQNSKK